MSKLNAIKIKAMAKFVEKKPEICLGVGIVCGAIAIGSAFKAGTKAHDILEKSKEEIEEVKEIRNREDISKEDYSDKDYQKDLVIAYGRAAGRVVKEIAPVVIFGTLSMMCFVKGQKVLKTRNVALGTAYKILDDQFEKYRERVIQEHGEEADVMYRNGIYKKDVEVETEDENGKTKKAKLKKQMVGSDEMPSQYARYFDQGNRNWDKSPEMNLLWLRSQQKLCNDILHMKGHIFLNDVYEILGYPKTEYGQYVGWMLGYGDNEVDFGIYDLYKEVNRDFVNGYEPVILLDFNVDGVISHLL